MPLKPRASPFHLWRKNRLIKAETSFIKLIDPMRYFGRMPSSPTWHILFYGDLGVAVCGRRGMHLTSPGALNKHITKVCSVCVSRIEKDGIEYV